MAPETRNFDMSYRPVLVLALTIAGCLVTTPVCAAIDDTGVLNDVTNRFLVQSATWGAVITKYAGWLFWMLATISMVWTFGMMALRKADTGEFFAEFVRFTVTTGFFWWLLSNGPAMAMDIINSLREIGAEAGRLDKALSPSSPISIGFNIVKKAFSGLSWVHPIDNLAIVLISAAIVLAMAVVAANILIALVTAWVMAYAGVFILGFGGGRWTSSMAIGYFKAMLGIGMELLTMTLLVAIAISVIDGFYKDLDSSSVYELLIVFCVCAVLALLVSKIPSRVAALSGGGLGAGAGVGTIVSGAAMAASAVATGGAALAAGAATVAGGAQALMAAASKALASDSGARVTALISNATGSGVAGGANPDSGAKSFGAAMGDLDGVTHGVAQAGSAYSAGKFAAYDDNVADTNSAKLTGEDGVKETGKTNMETAGVGGQHAAGTGKNPANLEGKTPGKTARVIGGTVRNLAEGTWQVGSAKASQLKSAAGERIAETWGGKVAAAISSTVPVARKDVFFDGDNLTAGTAPVNAEDEIAEFRDRGSDEDPDDSPKK